MSLRASGWNIGGRVAATGQDAVEQRELGAIQIGEVGGIAADAAEDGRGSQSRVGMDGTGLDGPEERIVRVLWLRVHRDGAAGKHAFGEGFAGFARALVAVSNDGDAGGVGAACGSKEILARELGSIPGSEELH